MTGTGVGDFGTPLSDTGTGTDTDLFRGGVFDPDPRQIRIRYIGCGIRLVLWWISVLYQYQYQYHRSISISIYLSERLD